MTLLGGTQLEKKGVVRQVLVRVVVAVFAPLRPRLLHRVLHVVIVRAHTRMVQGLVCQGRRGRTTHLGAA